MSTNHGVRAILALPRMPERQLRVLLALETFTRAEDGWRTAGTELLAEAAGLSPRTVAKARAELAAAVLLDYRRGDGRGNVSAYRVRVPGIDDHLKVATEVAAFPGGKGGRPAPVKVAIEPDKGGRRNAPTSTNAFGALKESALKASALPRPALAEGGDGAVSRSPEEGSRGMMIQDQFGDNGGGPRPAPQAHDDPPGTRLGTCPECGQTVAVTNDGKVGRHTATDRKNPGIWYHCPAEGRPPLTIVTP